MYLAGLNTGQRGTARFARKWDIGVLEGDTLPVANNYFIGMGWDSPEEARHLIVEADGHLMSIGSTRSGKSVGQVIPNVIWQEGSSFVIDPKGEIAWATAPYLRARGKKVAIVDPFGEVNKQYGLRALDQEKVSCYNPLHSLDPALPNYTDQIDYISDSLIMVEGKEPHWGNSARELIAGLIAYVVETNSEAKSLPRVRELICGGIEQIIEIATKIDDNSGCYGPSSIAWRKLKRYAARDVNNVTAEERSIISTAFIQLGFLDNSLIIESLSSSAFSFEELVGRNQDLVVFLVLPAEKLEKYNRWLRLMISMAISAVASSGGHSIKPVTFYLDEFGTIGSLPIVAQAAGIMAGKGLRLWIFIQTLSQLKRDYPDDWENFIGNSCAISVLKVMDNFTAEYISKMLGNTTLESRPGREFVQRINGSPYAFSSDIYRSASYFDDKEPMSTSARALLTSDEIRTFPDNLGILITDTHPAIFVKARSFEDKPFVDVVRPNPLYG